MTSVSDSVAFAGEFPAATREQWRALLRAALRGNAAEVDPEQALSTPTYDGLTLRPLYTEADRPPDFTWPTLGGRASTGIGWDVRQCHGGRDPAALNQAILADLDNGVTSIWLRLGGDGLAVADLGQALSGVLLDLAPVALDAGADTAAAAQAFVRLAADNGVASDEVAGSLGLDPIGAHVRTGQPTELGGLAEIAALCRARPKLAAITVDATLYHRAGGSDVQELAISAATSVAYLRALTDAGWSATEAARVIEFRYAVNADQFASIAKLRAARRIWARIGELCDIAPAGRQQRQHAVTSHPMLTQRDPWVNMLRATLACFAAATGGADSITVEPFDAAIGASDDFARRIARNTQAILHDESSLARVDDPASGSWYVESRTEQLAELAWDAFTAIERAGGVLAALDSGYLPNQVAEVQRQRTTAIAHRRDPITGVSEFAFIDEPPVVRPAGPTLAPSTPLVPDLRYAQGFESLRDRADRAARSSARPRIFLAALGSPAEHSARVSFAANLLQAGGIETVVGTGELAQQVAAVGESRTAIVCLCSSDAVYSDQAETSAVAFVQAGVSQVWLAGRPISEQPAAITGNIYAGVDAVAILTTLLDAVAAS